MAKVDTFFGSPRDMVTSAVKENEGSVKVALAALGNGSPLNIDYARWNKLYPYALILAEASKGLSGNEDDFTIGYKEVSRFVLPIPPDQLQITAPFAIQTTKTLGSVVEEHAGV